MLFLLQSSGKWVLDSLTNLTLLMASKDPSDLSLRDIWSGASVTSGGEALAPRPQLTGGHICIYA
jgi:hypothetical protein